MPTPEPMTRAERRRRLAAADKVAYRLLAKLRHRDVTFSTPRVAEAVGRIEYLGRHDAPGR